MPQMRSGLKTACDTRLEYATSNKRDRRSDPLDRECKVRKSVVTPVPELVESQGNPLAQTRTNMPIAAPTVRFA